MKNLVSPAVWLLSAAGMTLMAAELPKEMLGKLDFFLNYAIAEHLDMLEGEAQLGEPWMDLTIDKASAAVSGVAVRPSSGAVASGAQVSTAASRGGVK